MSGPARTPGAGLTWAVLAVMVGLQGCAMLGGSPPEALRRGDAAFRAGDYEAAARAYERHLATRPDEEVDQAVYLRLSVIYWMLGAPETDPERGEATLERMIAAHPEGRLREVAETMLSLRARVEAEAAGERGRTAALEARIRELERQIEALKAIDLESREAPD
ncbi:MAG: hypothetical protein R3326_01050 [Gemmatimonadota bacterium]|nr:hypothetical protein [Gemmatimonadota bacterium]